MEFKIEKTQHPVRPFQVINAVTGENVSGRRYLTEEAATADLELLRKQHQVKPVGPFGGFHPAEDDYGTAAFKAFFDDKPKPVVTQEDSAKKFESPKPQPSKDPVTPVSVQEVADLEAKLKELQEQRDRAMAKQATGDQPSPDYGDALDVVEEAIKADKQLAALKQRVEQVEQLTENVARVAEMYS